MKKLLLLPVIFFAAAFSSIAQDGAAESEAMGFLRTERNPERVAMAGAGAALGNGGSAFSAFGSPAIGVRTGKKIEAGGSYAIWAPSINGSTNIAGGVNYHLTSGLAISAGYVREQFKELDLGGGTSYAPLNQIIAAGASLLITPSLSLGASVNFATQQLLEDYSLSGTSVDIQACYSISGFSVAGGVRCLGGKVSDSSLPTSANLDLGYILSFGSVDLAMAADADYYFSGNYSAAAGVEASILNLVQIRAGYRFSSPRAVIPSHLALGAGLSLGPARVSLSYLTASEYLGGTLLFGFGVGF